MLSLFALVALIPAVLGHGEITKVQVLGGGSSDAPNIYYDGDAKNGNTAIRKMFQASFPAFTVPADYGDAGKMSCESAGGAPQSITIAAGQTMRIFWEGATGELDGTPFGRQGSHPFVHAMGPAMDYLAKCDGACSNFDAANARWTKIAHFGLDRSQSISGELRQAMANKPENYFPGGAGVWAHAKMIQDGSQWDVTIPGNLQAGEYLLRNEFASVHNPLNGYGRTGPQHYIGCIQLKVTGSGSDTLPSGFLGSQLYDAGGDFARYNVYADSFANEFPIPGPGIWEGATSTAPANSPPANPAPVTPAPVNPAPVDPAPVNPAPVDPAPVNADPAPVNPAPVTPAPVTPAPVDPAPASSGRCKRGSRTRRGTRRAVVAAQHKRRMEH